MPAAAGPDGERRPPCSVRLIKPSAQGDVSRLLTAGKFQIWERSLCSVKHACRLQMKERSDARVGELGCFP